jgi:hypothetical protein
MSGDSLYFLPIFDYEAQQNQTDAKELPQVVAYHKIL